MTPLSDKAWLCKLGIHKWTRWEYATPSFKEKTCKRCPKVKDKLV